MQFGLRGIAVGVVGVAAALALALALRQVPWETFDRQRWASTVQIVGTMTTAIGLAVAYLRTTRFRERRWRPAVDRMRRIYYELRGGGPIVTGTAAMPLKPMSTSAGREGPAPFVRVRNASAEERIRALEAIIDRLIGEDIPSIIERIKDMKPEIDAARSLAKSESDKALTEAQKAIKGLARDVDRTQTLDLRWAILGLLITAGGMVLGWA